MAWTQFFFLFLPIWFSFLRCEYFHIFLWWTSYWCYNLYVLLWRRIHFFISMKPWGNRGQRGEMKQWHPGLGKGRNGWWSDQKAVNYFIASISLPSGNSGNGIKRHGLRDRHAYSLAGPLTCLGTTPCFFNSHNLVTTHQQGSVLLTKQSQVASFSYTATLWNVPEIGDANTLLTLSSYLVTSASHFLLVQYHVLILGENSCLYSYWIFHGELNKWLQKVHCIMYPASFPLGIYL